jgi:FKBP-type peptidyl-prolyl cis-trans isomerase
MIIARLAAGLLATAAVAVEPAAETVPAPVPTPAAEPAPVAAEPAPVATEPASTTPAPAAAAPETAAVPAPAPAAELTLKQKASYLIGQQMAETVRHYNLDAELVSTAILDSIAGKPPVVDQKEAQQVLTAFQAEIEGAKAKAAAERTVTNKSWLEENKKKPGIVVTASGLQYQVVKEGPADGKKPTASDQVKVNYTGALTDGTVFDASASHGGPATFGVGQVIKGWTEALQLMKPGDSLKLYIPAELAYGEQAPPQIGPNQILVFDVELLEVLGGGPQTLKP